MATVWLSNEYRDVADRLAKNPTAEAGKQIFPTYMELAVFAALVGFSDGRKLDLDPQKRGPEIPDEIFVRNQRDGIVYLMALQDAKTAEILREKNEHDCWRIFESYANRGLSLISDWLLANPTDVDGVTTVLTAIKERAVQLIETTEPAPIGPVTF